MKKTGVLTERERWKTIEEVYNTLPLQARLESVANNMQTTRRLLSELDSISLKMAAVDIGGKGDIKALEAERRRAEWVASKHIARCNVDMLLALVKCEVTKI